MTSLANHNAYGHTRSIDAAKIHGLPLPQDRNKGHSERRAGYSAAMNASRRQVSNDGSSSDDLLSRVKKHEIQTGQSEGFSSSMKKQSRNHPLRTPQNLELSRSLRTTRNNSAISTNRDLVIVSSDCDSDENNPRASFGCQNDHSSGGSRQVLPTMNTDDFLEPVSFAAQRNVPCSPDHHKGSHKNTSMPESSPQVTEQQNDGIHGNHGEDPPLVFGSSSGDILRIFLEAPQKLLLTILLRMGMIESVRMESANLWSLVLLRMPRIRALPR